MRIQPAEWHSWFGAGLVRPGLWVRPQPTPVDFHYAENRQRRFRMIMEHVKDPLLLAKLKVPCPVSHLRAQVPPSWEESGRQNYLQRLIYHIHSVALKRGTS
ncbi:hypothetical protein TNCV_4345961 [Trichonephila clavipes]|nr:hypothetical protein TNCV_4345961 [Trichonephila clavipes]